VETTFIFGRIDRCPECNFAVAALSQFLVSGFVPQSSRSNPHGSSKFKGSTFKVILRPVPTVPAVSKRSKIHGSSKFEGSRVQGKSNSIGISKSQELTESATGAVICTRFSRPTLWPIGAQLLWI